MLLFYLFLLLLFQIKWSKPAFLICPQGMVYWLVVSSKSEKNEKYKIQERFGTVGFF